MPKRILYLSFYFEPDLCAGSFRNTPLAYELAAQGASKDIKVDVFTTLPNRYSTYSTEAEQNENQGNISITRIKIPLHKSGIKDQIQSFRTFYNSVRKLVRNNKYDMVYSSSSRLFTAYLGYRIAKENKLPLYLDIRDIFVDTIKDVFPNPFIKAAVLPFMKYIESKTFSYASHINLISGGFKEYFLKYSKANYTDFTNGIDPEFLNAIKLNSNPCDTVKTIVYAGNIGEGQGLHRIIPIAAKSLGADYKFKIIGDGGAKGKLIEALNNIENVELLPPVNRMMLIDEYNKADFLFIHLNDFEAFKKVLPSKVFELGVFSKPLIAGVNGFSRLFIEDNLPGSILVEPCNGDELASSILNYKTPDVPLDRNHFINSFKRETINKKMAESILAYI